MRHVVLGAAGMLAAIALTGAQANEKPSDKLDKLRAQIEEQKDKRPRFPLPGAGSAPDGVSRPAINWTEIQASLEATRDDAGQTLGSLREASLERLASIEPPELKPITMPVLIPGDEDVLEDTLQLFGQPDAYTATGSLSDGTAIRIAGSRKKLVLKRPPPPREALKKLKEQGPPLPEFGAKFVITRSEGSTDLSFSRFGCGYVLSIMCDDPENDSRCSEDAYIKKIASSMKLLRGAELNEAPEEPVEESAAETAAVSSQEVDDISVVGTGEPEPDPAPDQPTSPEASTPASSEPSFTYLPVGELLPQSGPGFADATVYRPDILFPTEDEAFLNSQVYRYGGYQGGLNNMEGGQCEAANYTYPWQDTFCEKRSRDQQLCPGGGHEGLDIRPASCSKNKHWAVAVEDARVVDIRRHWVTLQTGDGTIYNYLHLNMAALEVAEGDTVRKGDRLGLISNDFYKSDGSSVATTIHLHFEMYENYVTEEDDDEPMFTKVNPYMTLVNAYDRRLR